jgi:hypothetical protein
MLRKLGLALAILAFVGFTERPAAAVSKCAAAKILAAGKKAAAKAKCHQKAQTKLTLDPVCLAKAEAKFAGVFPKAESKADCLAPDGDAPAIEATVDSFIDDLASELAPLGNTGSKCTAAKFGAGGKKVLAKAKCFQKEQKQGTLDPSCLSKAEATFSGGFTKAEANGDCQTMGDASAIEGKVDAFVTETVAALTAAPTTTTSTTTSTTTTSPPTPVLTNSAGAFLLGTPKEILRGHLNVKPDPAGGPQPYNCLAFALARSDAWCQRMSTGTGITAATIADVVADNGFALHACPSPLTAAKNPCPGGKHLALLSYHLPAGSTPPVGINCPADKDWIHAMRQLPDGTWVSKNGQGPDYAGITDPAAFMDGVPAYKPTTGQTRAVCCFCQTTTTTTSTTTTTTVP